MITHWPDLRDREPSYALVANVDLVVIKHDNEVSVFYGRCLHRGALLADGFIEGNNLVCGVHYWDFKFDTGVSKYDNEERLHKFSAWIENDKILVDETEIAEWGKENPQPYQRDDYLGLYADPNIAGPDGFSPLMSAVLNGSYQLVEILLESGADPSLKDINSETAFSIAEDKDEEEILLRLGKSGG